MIHTIWHPLARRELLEASSFYEQESPGLGAAFLDEAERSVERLTRFPAMGRAVDHECRCYVVKRFPYSIFYRLGPAGSTERHLFLLAIAHHKRRPRYWARRL